MDDDVEFLAVVFVDFDEVVPGAERSKPKFHRVLLQVSAADDAVEVEL